MNPSPRPGQPGAGPGQPGQAGQTQPGAQATAGQNRQQPQLLTSQMIEKIPLLTPDEKARYQALLDQLWTAYKALPADSAEAATARGRIAEASRGLMLRVHTKNRQHQQAQQAQQAQSQAQAQQQRTGTPQQTATAFSAQSAGAQNQAAGAANTAPAAGSAQAGGQQSPQAGGANIAPARQGAQVPKIPPAIMKHVNEMNILLSPQAIAKGGDTRSMIADLRKQYTIALVTMENTRNKIQQIDNLIKDRQEKGTLKPEEQEAFRQHKEQTQRAHDEARKSLEQFRQQQEQLRAQAEKNKAQQQGGAGAQGQSQTQQAPGQGGQIQPQGQIRPQPAQNLSQTAGAPSDQQLQNPQAVTATVNAAVEAAKNQAPQIPNINTQTGAAQIKPQPGAQVQQPQVGIKQEHPQPQPVNTQAAALAQQSLAGTPTQTAAQVPTPQSATPVPGNGRPLSMQAAVQAANERVAQPGTPMPGQPANGSFVASANGGATPSAVPSHSHPVTPQQQTVQSYPAKMPIAKQLPDKATQPPQAVGISGGAGPGRPTYNGGTGTSGGVVTQPALPRVPMYVHEAEGEHVLSKKKLDELVRQVCGGSAEGQEENLMAPEVEEVRT